MKTIFASVALVPLAVVSPALASTCLQTQDIISTHSDDGKLLVFELRNGQTLVNHLQGVCSDLKYSGFVWTVRGIGRVCENEESLRVLNSGQVCELGKFDAPVDKKALQ